MEVGADMGMDVSIARGSKHGQQPPDTGRGPEGHSLEPLEGAALSTP